MQGLEAFERKLFETKVNCGMRGKYCVGDNVTLADIFLVPQVYSALRYSAELKNCTFISVANCHLTMLPEFMETMPEKQPNYVPPYYRHVPTHIDNDSQ
ncbi:hypothetical protein BJV82DRAFT_681979 [Fennellomyces sp. T-0311]|nr:hypothetical protein BJV82DRAFT_681979 [Fennellomyces sp. T-0311]